MKEKTLSLEELIVANHWSKVDCSSDEKNFYNFPILRARHCKLIFNEISMNKDWCEYWTVEKYLKEKMPFEKCLSICSGFGEVERFISKSRIAKKIVGTDIASGAIEEAKKRAAEENLNNIEYYVSNINKENLPENEYDLIWANGALHHISNLEHVIPMLYNTLKPGGILISNEYVGPNYQQISERQIEIINAVRHLLPNELKREKKDVNNVYEQLYKGPPSIDHFLKTDPSECVRSNEIIPFLKKSFDEVEIKYFHGSILFYALDSKFYNNFDINNTNHIKILEMLFNIEDSLIESGELTPDNAHIICRKTA